MNVWLVAYVAGVFLMLLWEVSANHLMRGQPHLQFPPTVMAVTSAMWPVTLLVIVFAWLVER